MNSLRTSVIVGTAVAVFALVGWSQSATAQFDPGNFLDNVSDQVGQVRDGIQQGFPKAASTSKFN